MQCLDFIDRCHKDKIPIIEIMFFKQHISTLINSLRPGDTICHWRTRSSLLHIRAYHLIGSITNQCSLIANQTPTGETSLKFEWNDSFILQCHLQNVLYFVPPQCVKMILPSSNRKWVMSYMTLLLYITFVTWVSRSTSQYYCAVFYPTPKQYRHELHLWKQTFQ